MDFYTESMMKIVGMPKKVTLYGKSVPTELLFSPSMAESLLYWHASNISMNLHGEVLLDTRVVSAPDEVSGTRLESLTKDFPVIFNHLLPFKERAIKRYDKGDTGGS